MTQTPPDVDVEPGAQTAEDDFADRHFRRNFGLLIGEAGSFMAGLAFFDSTTVYPLLLARLGASDTMIGMARLVQVLGYTLPALLAAHRIQGRAMHKGFLLKTCAVARAGLFTIPLALLLFARDRPGVALAWTFCFVAIFWLMDGACAISWFDIVAKAIPARIRGRFFGIMQTAAGLLAIGAGLIVHQVLQSPSIPFPTNFALLGGLWFVGAMGSQLGLALIHEPPGHASPTEARLGLGAYLAQTRPLLRRSPRLRSLIITRILLDGAGLAAPFYVLYAQRDLGASLQMAGVYTIAQNFGRVATGPLWGWVSDRLGTSTAVRTIALCIAATPAAALMSTGNTAWLMVVVFALMGAAIDGVWMIMSTAILETVPAEERPLAIGVASVCQTPSALYGPLGGLLAGLASYRVVFGLATAASLLGAISAFRVKGRARAEPA